MSLTDHWSVIPTERYGYSQFLQITVTSKSESSENEIFFFPLQEISGQWAMDKMQEKENMRDA